MAVTKAKKSSLSTAAKYIDAGAGNTGYTWAGTEFDTNVIGSALGTLVAPDGLSLMEVNGGYHGVVNTGGPSNPVATVDGITWGFNKISNIGYGTYADSFNGALIGGGNYISSSAAYCNNISNGWTLITGLTSVSANFGAGSGGYTSLGVPVWVIPYSQSTIHKIAYIVGAIGTSGVPSASWTTNVTVNSVAGNGYQAKVAVTNNLIVYAGYSNTTPSTGTFFIRAASIDATTGAPGTWNAGTLSITGLMTSLRSVNGTFVITTADNKIYTSTDGTNWTTRTSPFAGTSALYVTNSSSGYMLAATGASNGTFPPMYISKDGINWITHTTYSLAVTSTLTAVTAANNGMVFTVLNGSGPGNVYYANRNRLG